MKLTRQHRREARLLWQAVLIDGQPDEQRIQLAVGALQQKIGRDAEPVLRCFLQRLEAYLRASQVTVVSAEPLSPERQEQIGGMVDRSRKAGIQFVVDPSVLGGLRLEQGYLVTDRTIARQLDVLQDMLLKN